MSLPKVPLIVACGILACGTPAFAEGPVEARAKDGIESSSISAAVLSPA
jgi:hypothetical protein